MLALWSCGRRGSVVQAQRQIHRAFAGSDAATYALRHIRHVAQFAQLRILPFLAGVRVQAIVVHLGSVGVCSEGFGGGGSPTTGR